MDTHRQFNRVRKQLIGVSLVLLAVLLIWWVWFTWLRAPSPVDLPYSAFLEQVQDGNVRSVTITGSEIDGLFARPVTGPVPVTGGAGDAQNLAFRTRFPEVAGDPNLVGLLATHNVQITAVPASVTAVTHNPAVVPLLGLALLGAMLGIVTGRERLWHGLQRLNPFHHHPHLAYTSEHPLETYDCIAGQDGALNAVKSLSAGGDFPSILLLVGPAGTGKTRLARAIASEQDALLITCRAAQLLAPSVTPDQVRGLFQAARDSAPSVLLIEGLEAASRDSSPAFRQLLAELDGLEDGQGVVVLGESRSPEKIDPALLDAGRFNRLVALELPDRKGREAILSLHTRGLHLASNVNLGVIARTTTGFSGAELADLCAAAARKAAARKAQGEGRAQLSMPDFEDALDHLLIQSPHELLLNDQVRRAAAYHEAGHALVAWILPHAAPLKRISVLSPGRISASAGSGASASAGSGASAGAGSGVLLPDGAEARILEADAPVPDGPGAEGWNGNRISKADLMARLAVMLGGRAAEEIATGDVTISAENDLLEATRLARRMVTRWGMGSLGLMAFDPAAKSPRNPGAASAPRAISEGAISEATAAQIDRDVQSVLASRYAAVRKMLEDAREPLEQLARALLVDETLDQEEISQILGPRPLTISDEAGALSAAS